MNSRNWVPIVSYFFGNGWLFVNVKPGSGPVVRSRRQRTRRVKSVFAYEKTNAEKYVLVPDRATTVTFENLCSVAARSTTLSLESSPTCDKRPSLRNENLHPRGPSRADRGHRHIHALVQRKKPAGRGRSVEADELCLRQSSHANIILGSVVKY